MLSIRVFCRSKQRRSPRSVELRGFFESLDFVRLQTTGRPRHPQPTEKAQIGGKGSKPRDDPQPRPVLRNPAKHGIFAISHNREVLAKMPRGSGMKNLTHASRGALNWTSFAIPRVSAYWREQERLILRSYRKFMRQRNDA